jgi:hypothetical protein
MEDAGLGDDNKHPYNKYTFGLYLLDSVRGISGFDEQIRELLTSQFRVILSDRQFARFVNFLSSAYPIYPSWTPTINKSRDLRANKKKYYDAYLIFKRQAH